MVSHSGLALQHVSKQLQADREVVMAAVKDNGDALQYASEYLQGDVDLVRQAVAGRRVETGPLLYTRCDPKVVFNDDLF